MSKRMSRAAMRAHKMLVSKLLASYDQPMSATRLQPDHGKPLLFGFDRNSSYADAVRADIHNAATGNKVAATPLTLTVLDQSEPVKHHPRNRVKRSQSDMRKNLQRQRDREAVREQRRIAQRKAATGKTSQSCK